MSSVKIEALTLADVKVVTPRVFEDHRGAFAEIYNSDRFGPSLGLDGPFVQDNWSRSILAGTVRALHFQRWPNPQGKLVRVTRGAIKDVAVDVRAGSSSYGQHVTFTLTDESPSMLWVPAGFAHGFVTLTATTEVTYKVTHPYDPSAEVGVRWNDPALGIDWGVSENEATLADRDRYQPLLSEIEPFTDRPDASPR